MITSTASTPQLLARVLALGYSTNRYLIVFFNICDLYKNSQVYTCAMCIPIKPVGVELMFTLCICCNSVPSAAILLSVACHCFMSSCEICATSNSHG